MRTSSRNLLVVVVAAVVLAPACADESQPSSGERGSAGKEAETRVLAVGQVACPAGWKRVCEPNCDENQCGKPICTCEPPVVPSVSGTIVPRFMITHVVYAVPGKSSKVSYSRGSRVGSSVSSTKSWKNDFDVTVGAGFKFLAGGEAEVSFGHAWGTTESDVTDVVTERSTTYERPGHYDLVDHDDDEVHFLMNPRLDVTTTPAGPGGLKGSVSWRFAADQSGAQPYRLTVRELKNGVTEEKRRALATYEITPADFPTLLKADPFAQGNTTIDMDRFEFIGGYEYSPPLDPDHDPIKFHHELSWDEVRTTSVTKECEYSVGVSAKLGVNVSKIVEISGKAGFQHTWTSSSTTADIRGKSTRDTFTLGQPAFGYTGPGFIDVYVDRIWKTYLFAGRCGNRVGHVRCDVMRPNLALNRPAFQTPEIGPSIGGEAWKAVDGNTDGNFWNGSVTHTTGQSFGPWWWVDLGSVKHIGQINLFNRTDCCRGRLSHYEIYVSDDSTNGWDGNWPRIVDQSATVISDGDMAPRQHAVDVWARWVAVRLASDAPLSLAEVQVLGF